MRTKDVALVAIVGSLYFALVWLFQIISFYVIQIRIADCLIPISAVLGYPAVIGVSVGCLVANTFAPWGSSGLVILDMILGTLTNFLASYAVYRVSRNGTRVSLQLGCVFATIIVTLIVGTYIPLLVEWAYGVPSPIWLGWLGVGLGSVISINVVGYVVTQTLKRGGAVKGILR